MPLFSVTWTQTAEWIVEGDDAKVIQKLAEDVSMMDVDFDDTVVDVSIIGAKHEKLLREKNRIDAVAMDGELMDPAEAEDAKLLHACNNLLVNDEHLEIECPSCQHVKEAQEWEDDGYLTCSRCAYSLTLGDVEYILGHAQPDTRTINMFEEEK